MLKPPGPTRTIFLLRQPDIQPGQEPDVIDAFASLADNQESEFDWFDAAVLSYQMGRRLETELDQIAG